MTFAEVQRYPRDWGVMDETPRRYDPATGKVVPIIPYGFDINRPLPDSSEMFPRTMEWNYERDGYNPLEGFGPIGPYRPEIDKSEVVPLDNVFSSLFDIARANSANPHRTFIKDPTGSGKLVPFHLPLDLRTIEEKMGGYPFNQARNPVGDSVPIKPFKTNKGVEYMPYPYGPVQNFPRA